MSYDTNNIFARILRQEIQCNKVFEDEFLLTDLHPAAPIHVLVIPKENHTDFSSFCSCITKSNRWFFSRRQNIRKTRTFK